MSNDKSTLSPSGLGLNSISVPTRRTTRAAAPGSAAPGSAELTAGTLNGTQWADVEGKKVLYEFARDEGLDVSSRDNKATIVSVLSAATKAQG